MEKLIQTLGNLGSAPKSSYKERFLVHSGERIIPIDTDSIACFVSENKGTYLVNNEGTRYIISSSLDEIQPQLDPKAFFRISRSAIIAKKAVDTIEKLGGSRLTVITPGTGAFDVSRARVDDFLIWLEK